MKRLENIFFKAFLFLHCLVLIPIVSSPDALIADKLEERRILKSDIGLGFVPPNAREYMGYAMT